MSKLFVWELKLLKFKYVKSNDSIQDVTNKLDCKPYINLYY